MQTGHWSYLQDIGISLLLLATSSIRFRHCQRSVLIALRSYSVEAYCLGGKRSPPYKWSFARFCWGFDLGKAVFERWTQLCIASSSDKPEPFLVTAKGEALTNSEFQRDARYFLSFILEDPGVFVGYSPRRGYFTLCDICKVSHDDKVLVGGWAGRSDMPVRYSAHTQARVKSIRFALALVLEQLDSQSIPLTWDHIRAGILD